MEGERLQREIERKLGIAGVLSNLLGAIDLFVFGALLLPRPADDARAEVVLANALLFVPFMATTLVIGQHWIRRLGRPVRAWIDGGRAPTPEERDYALRLPLLGARISATFWAFAVVAFTVLNAIVAPDMAPAIPVILVLGGITTSTVDYLISERILRPVTVRALAAGLPDRPVGPGVESRVTLVWAAATGVPLLGILATAAAGWLNPDLDRELLAASIAFLACFGLIVGLVATRLSARAVEEPLAAVRAALEKVERGDYNARVPVDDGSELGLVEAGFNNMASGLQEREHLRDVFGRHVGEDVARAALESDLKLGGEVRDVGVLFVDVIGSTSIAEVLEPERVVTLLNEFFAVVVAVTQAHGGAVNKFEGDGALCVFGAPVARDDPAAAALAAARELHARLLDALPQVDAAIGVSAGPAVAGNVGAEERYEYTVIGDPVNEAARLSELAKLRPERLMASDAALQRADPREAARWALGEPTVLRGRQAPTRIATVGGGD